MIKRRTQNIFETLRRWWQAYWLLRWVVANMLGWSLGLLATAMMMWLLGMIGAIASGAILGLGISTPQAWVLFSSDEMASRRKWILYSSFAGFLAVFPALALSIIGIFNLWIAALLAGLVFGGIWGYLQSFVLIDLIDDRAYLWIPMCMGAGGLSALLTIPVLMTPIPLIFSPASIIFALMTGWLMLRWTSE